MPHSGLTEPRGWRLWCTWCVLCLRWVGVGSHLVRRRVAIGKLGSSQSTSKNAWCWVVLRWVVLGQWFQWAESKGGAGCFLSEGGRGAWPRNSPLTPSLFCSALSPWKVPVAARRMERWGHGGWKGAAAARSAAAAASGCCGTSTRRRSPAVVEQRWSVYTDVLGVECAGLQAPVMAEGSGLSASSLRAKQICHWLLMLKAASVRWQITISIDHTFDL